MVMQVDDRMIQMIVRDCDILYYLFIYYVYVTSSGDVAGNKANDDYEHAIFRIC